MPQEGEDQGGDGAEELLVVKEENAQCFRYGEDELPVRELEEELLVEVFGEQESAFLGAGGAKAVQLPALGIEPFTGKGTKVFETACNFVINRACRVIPIRLESVCRERERLAPCALRATVP